MYIHGYYSFTWHNVYLKLLLYLRFDITLHEIKLLKGSALKSVKQWLFIDDGHGSSLIARTIVVHRTVR